MKRTFQAKTTIKHYVLLAVILSVVICLYWVPMPRPILGGLLSLIFYFATVVISRMICTFYVIHTEGYMEIKKGRFSTDKNIQLADIKQIDRVRRSGNLVIIMNDNTEYVLIPPTNEQDFIKCIEKYRNTSSRS